MQSASSDPEAISVDALLRLSKLISKLSIRKCEALARRARELPQLVGQAGILATALFYMSKADKDVYKNTLLHLHTASDQPPEASGLKKRIEGECAGEGGGYSLALALLAYGISRASEGMQAAEKCLQHSNFQGLAACLQTLRESGNEVIVEAWLKPYLTSLKNLAEAFYA